MHEQSLISAVLYKNELFDSVSVRPEHFYSEKHGKIWDAITRLLNNNHKADIVSLSKELKGQVDSSYIAGLTNTPGNYEYAEQQVLSEYKRRELHKLQLEIQEHINDPVDEILSLTEGRLQRIYDTNVYQSHYIREALKDTVDDIERRYNAQGDYTGIPCGLTELDDMTNGFQNGDFIILGARPSVGKTACALSMIDHICMCKGIPAALYSLEMSERAINTRLLSMTGNLPGVSVRTGIMSQDDWSKLTTACEQIDRAQLVINDNSDMKIGSLVSDIRYVVRRFGVKIVFIDYISLITHPDRGMKRYEQVTEFSRELKRVAKVMDIPVVALSQVRRETEGRAPCLNDLRESGSLEQDADIVMFLHRERDSEDTELILAKQRNGPTGTVHLRFMMQYGKFIGR